MQDIFIKLATNPSNYIYECAGTIKTYKGERAEHEQGKYLVVSCDKCSNVPVYHLLKPLVEDF